MRSRPSLHLAASRAIWGIVREHAIGPSCSSAYPRPVNEALGYRAACLAAGAQRLPVAPVESAGSQNITERGGARRPVRVQAP